MMAVLFPGQGSQRVAWVRTYSTKGPSTRRWESDYLRLIFGYSLRGVCLEGAGETLCVVNALSIARALLRSPRLFLFDEPTSSLDSLVEERGECNDP